MGWGDFSCSSSEVGDQVFVGMPKRWWFCAPIPCIGIYIYIIYMNGWAFNGENLVNVGIPYMDAMGLDGCVGWLVLRRINMIT